MHAIRLVEKRGVEFVAWIGRRARNAIARHYATQGRRGVSVVVGTGGEFRTDCLDIGKEERKACR